jgi:hypothetical protein
MPRTPLLAFLLLLVPLAGCIEVPQDGDRARGGASWAADVEPPADRIEGMTADESKEDTAGPCEGSQVQIPPGAYCAQRVLTVTGRIGVERLPVELLGGNGDVTLAESPGDAWSFVATIQTRGLTEEDARRGLDAAWSWSHEDGEGGHHLKAAPTGGIPLLGAAVASAKYEVALPAWVLLDLRAETTNGGVSLRWGEAERVRVGTTNGAVSLHGSVADVSVATTNGGIDADLRATESGAWAFRTTNGGIDVRAPEDARQAYDVDASTTNGRIEILLEGGEHDERGRRHAFRTHGYDERAVQTAMTLETTNGHVTVGV